MERFSTKPNVVVACSFEIKEGTASVVSRTPSLGKGCTTCTSFDLEVYHLGSSFYGNIAHVLPARLLLSSLELVPKTA
jgi:hypothetical protein